MDAMDWDSSGISPRRNLHHHHHHHMYHQQQHQQHYHPPQQSHQPPWMLMPPMASNGDSQYQPFPASTCPGMRHLVNRQSTHYDPVHASANYAPPWDPAPNQTYGGVPYSQHSHHPQQRPALPGEPFSEPMANGLPTPFAHQGLLPGGYHPESTRQPYLGFTPTIPVVLGQSRSGRGSTANTTNPGVPVPVPVPATSSASSFAPAQATSQNNSPGFYSSTANTVTSSTETNPAAPSTPEASPMPSNGENTPGQAQAQTSSPNRNQNAGGRTIQFGSAPPASFSPQRNAPTTSPYRSHRLAGPNGSLHPISGQINPLLNLSGERQGERRRSNASRRTPRPRMPPMNAMVDADTAAFIESANAAFASDRESFDEVRTAQLMRGSVRTKTIVSTGALRSLQSVPMSELSENEKTCVICYNEYGVKTPEGVSETPLRLPKCKHVFGDHCIRKWFEESDSCPYCRDKLPAETRVTTNYSAWMSAAYGRSDYHSTHSHRARITPISRNGLSRALPLSMAPSIARMPTERRSPPTEGEEDHRRQRPRHSWEDTPRSGMGPSAGLAAEAGQVQDEDQDRRLTQLSQLRYSQRLRQWPGSGQVPGEEIEESTLSEEASSEEGGSEQARSRGATPPAGDPNGEQQHEHGNRHAENRGVSGLRTAPPPAYVANGNNTGAGPFFAGGDRTFTW